MANLSSLAGASAQESVFDLGKLGDLRRAVTRAPDDRQQQAEVARQFEAVFIQMTLKRMREATPKDGLFDSQHSDMLRGMADEQLALQLARPGLGLADALLAQMQGGAPEAQADGEGPQGGQAVSALLRVMQDNRPADRALAAAEGAPRHVVDFVSRVAGAAKAAAADSGVPARLILGQAALESGWGRREILHPDGRTSHNLFGIKAGASWKGKVVHVMTTEYVDGVPRKLSQPFRAYDSYEASFRDYARLIGGSPRYEAVARAGNEVEAARRIQDAGYATDPRYADKLIQIMGQLRAQPLAAGGEQRPAAVPLTLAQGGAEDFSGQR